METLVLVTTYNGRDYINEQLQSILNQSLVPDRVIIADDKSTDNTCLLIKKFIKQNDLTNWKLIENQKNLGWRKNFFELLKSYKSDYVFLCDQDDIWYEDKVERMVSVMKDNPNIKLLTSDYTPLYESKDAVRISRKIMKTMDNEELIKKIEVKENFLSVLRPGCTYCISKDLLEVFNDYPYDNSAHDSILWNLSLLFDGLYNYSKPTIYFRRHGHNNTPSRAVTKDKIINNISHRLKVIENLKRILTDKRVDVNNFEKKMLLLRKQYDFYELRLEMLRSKKTKLWFELFFNYRKFYFSFKRMFYDFFLTFK